MDRQTLNLIIHSKIINYTELNNKFFYYIINRMDKIQLLNNINLVVHELTETIKKQCEQDEIIKNTNKLNFIPEANVFFFFTQLIVISRE